MEVFDNSISLVKDIQSGSPGLLTKENLLKSLKVEQFVDWSALIYPLHAFESLMEVISRTWRDLASALSQRERRLKRWSPAAVLVTDI